MERDGCAKPRSENKHGETTERIGRPHVPEPAAHIATPSLHEAPRTIASIVHRTTMPVATVGKFVDDTIAAIG
jgi:hypothetical protein